MFNWLKLNELLGIPKIWVQCTFNIGTYYSKSLIMLQWYICAEVVSWFYFDFSKKSSWQSSNPWLDFRSSVQNRRNETKNLGSFLSTSRTNVSWRSERAMLPLAHYHHWGALQYQLSEDRVNLQSVVSLQSGISLRVWAGHHLKR